MLGVEEICPTAESKLARVIKTMVPDIEMFAQNWTQCYKSSNTTEQHTQGLHAGLLAQVLNCCMDVSSLILCNLTFAKTQSLESWVSDTNLIDACECNTCKQGYPYWIKAHMPQQKKQIEMIEQLDRALGKYDLIQLKACATFDGDLVMDQCKFKYGNPHASKSQNALSPTKGFLLPCLDKVLNADEEDIPVYLDLYVLRKVGIGRKQSVMAQMFKERGFNVTDGTYEAVALFSEKAQQDIKTYYNKDTEQLCGRFIRVIGYEVERTKTDKPYLVVNRFDKLHNRELPAMKSFVDLRADIVATL